MKTASRVLLFVSLLGYLPLSGAQHPATGSSAKEQRNSASMKKVPGPDRAQADAKNIKKQRKEAMERSDVKMKSAQTEMTMGAMSAAGQASSARAATGKSGKPPLNQGQTQLKKN